MTTTIANNDAHTIPPKRASTLRQFFTLLLLALGLQLWILLGRTQLGERRQLLAAFAAVICALFISIVRPLGNSAARLPQRLSDPSPAARRFTAFIITVLSIFYLYATARSQHRDFSPILHDEY